MLIEILVLCLSLVIYVIYKVKNGQKYWQKLGVKTPPITFLVGNHPLLHLDVILQRRNINEILAKQFQMFKKERFYGVYFLHNPSIVINDADLVKQITVKDFDHFVDRSG